jgi:hypothetical protein
MFRPRRALSWLVLAGGLAFAHAAQAGVCSAPPPQPGQVIEGPVLHVDDGGTLCVAQSFDPQTWVALKVAASDDEAPKRALMAVAFGRDAVCKVEAVTDGQALASCTIEQRPLAALLQQPGVLKAGGDWR